MDFYWIDSYINYDKSFVNSVLNVFINFYKPIAKDNNIDFSFIEATDIDIRVSKETELIYKNKNLLENKFCAVVQYSNISSKIEKHIETIYRIIKFKNKLFNNSNKIDFVDRDKMFGLNLATSFNIPIIPTVLISQKNNYKSYIKEIREFIGEPPYILKPKEMLSGLGIIKIESINHLNSILDIIMTSTKDFIIQKFMQNLSDYRIYVIDGKGAKGARQDSAKWYTSYCSILVTFCSKFQQYWLRNFLTYSNYKGLLMA